MATNGNAFGDFFQTQLEMDPQLAYMGRVGQQQFGGTQPMQDRAQQYFANQFGDVFNQYTALKGKELYQGKDPAKQTTFVDFMEDYATESPFTQRYSRLTPSQRGVSTRRFAPSTRYILY